VVEVDVRKKNVERVGLKQVADSKHARSGIENNPYLWKH